MIGIAETANFGASNSRRGPRVPGRGHSSGSQRQGKKKRKPAQGSLVHCTRFSALGAAAVGLGLLSSMAEAIEFDRYGMVSEGRGITKVRSKSF